MTDQPEIPELDPPAALERLRAGDTTFVDIRDPRSFQAAHVPGALHLQDANLQAFLAETPRERPLLVYCYHGYSSLGAVAFLLEHGFEQVASLRGGFQGWQEVGGATDPATPGA